MIEDLQSNVEALQRGVHGAKAEQLLRQTEINLRLLEDIAELATDPDFDIAERYIQLERANDIVVTRLERIENDWRTHKNELTCDSLGRLLSTLESVLRS